MCQVILSMETLLVTGGCGFIGSNFIKYVLDASSSMRVVNVDCLTYAGTKRNLAGYLDDARLIFHEVDIRDVDSLKPIFKRYDIEYVVHFAAETHVDRSIRDPRIFIETNVLGAFNLLSLSLEHDINRFLQISTDEVYGSLAADGKPFTELSCLSPNNPYSASKASADFLARAFNRTYGLPVIIVRSSNNYGPHQFPEKFIPVVIIRAMENKKVPIYGSGGNMRDWLHVFDHCRGIWYALTRGKVGGVYNFCSGIEVTNIKLARMILALMRKSDDLITFVDDRPGHDFRYAMNSSKAKAELG